jgi:hypothetical protein
MKEGRRGTYLIGGSANLLFEFDGGAVFDAGADNHKERGKERRIQEGIGDVMMPVIGTTCYGDDPVKDTQITIARTTIPTLPPLPPILIDWRERGDGYS